jgi:hypothetical protein
MLGESVRRRQSGGRGRGAGGAPPGRRFNWKPLLVGLPLALTVPFILGYFLASRVLFPPTPVSGTGIPVPDLVGRDVSEAQRMLAAAGLGGVDASELPHPTAPAGQAVAQSPLPGQQLLPGVGVQVALSAGRPRGVVPDVVGFSADRAAEMLRRSGFEVMHATEESAAAAGRVIRTEPAPGGEVGLPASITLVVSSGPPVARDTVPPDTLWTGPGTQHR